ncbi:HAMP domain-containing histidine kinase [Methylocystis sp. H62]|uniref:sensor histidine kinase n=1 Tax=Methylocystis sp. H62 TaxID=2785789 RepID=UPI0018C343F6|nr:HAMP domain-containing sensor histidine kinase [Methylocystis sp. H62]MBG0791997.1 HAMP domain-containing histidine kinase [Methylocystis sp. H62]
MTSDTSLTRRVVGYLFAAQLVAFLIGAVLTMALELAKVAYFRTSLDELATYRVSDLVIRSLGTGEDGTIRIIPVAELVSEVERAPQLKFAVFDEARKPLVGSSPELISTLIKAGVIQITAAHLHFNLPEDLETTPLGYMERRRTPFGWFHVAIYRQKFRWDDVFGYLLDALQWMAVYLVMIALLSASAAWFAVRQGLSPLRDAARQAESIDLDSLDRTVDAKGVPIEIRPFVTAINAGLARLHASAARMRRYTANAAHELRTPLAIMRARLEDAEEPTFKSDLLRDASHLQAIVEQMLIAARLSERQTSLEQQVDLASTIRKIVIDYSPLVIECERHIEFDAPTNLVPVRGNARAIECVAANLIDNALRMEPIGGTVIVKVTADAVVAVTDHGEGVDPADRELIFEPFWRKNEATPGTGLGLAISKELIDKLGGRIWVEETPGGGATFKLWFPAATSETHANLNNAHSSLRSNARS